MGLAESIRQSTDQVVGGLRKNRGGGTQREREREGGIIELGEIYEEKFGEERFEA